MSTKTRFRVTSTIPAWIGNHLYLPGDFVELDTTAAKYLLLWDIIDYEVVPAPTLSPYQAGDKIVLHRGEKEYVISDMDLATFFATVIAPTNPNPGIAGLDFSNPQNSALVGAVVA